MAKKKQKFYVVWVGATPGIYDSWDQCKLQIQGYPGAKYKSFRSLQAAQQAFDQAATDHIGTGPKSSVMTEFSTEGIIWDSLSVDAACSGSPGVMEYRGVWTQDRTEVFHRGPYEWGTNNVGEFMALIHGIAWLQKQGMHNIPIYSDSRTALAWLRNRKTKTTLERRSSNKELFELFDRAEEWMNKSSWTNKILKWETKKWGEIPADFGRK
ncbi:MAG: ribonuclease H family protein [Bacteroidota bacterium]